MSSNRYSDWSKDELLIEIESLTKSTRFGLVWENQNEDVVSELKNSITVFDEINSRSLASKTGLPNYLIEGENLGSLSSLIFTHSEKIDVIYIDPPYNTGNDDFKYNDSFIQKENSFRHSSWLSFLSKRLWLAKDLLKRSGIIIISIDDNEQAHLKLLCDEIFGENNFVACIPTIMNLKGNQDEYAFAGTHEYTLIYTKDKIYAKFNNLPMDLDLIEDDWEHDDIGWWKKGAGLKMTGINAPRLKQPSLFFPVWVKPDGSEISIEEKKNWDKILPITDGKEMSWRWSKGKFERDKSDVILSGKSPQWTIYKKQRPALGEMPSKKPKSVFYRPEYSTTNGANQIKAIFGEKVFDYPKPLDLIIDLLTISTQKDAVVLDFFAGSGTTGHAVLALNKMDGGSRRFILCTNNENEIAEKVTYERIKRISKPISGLDMYSNLPTTMYYLKAKLVSNSKTDSNKKKIVKQLNTLLKMKEDCFDEVCAKSNFSIFTNNRTGFGIVFGEDEIQDFREVLMHLNLDRLTIYVFSYESDDFSDYFDNMPYECEIYSIPSSVLNAFRNANARGVNK